MQATHILSHTLPHTHTHAYTHVHTHTHKHTHRHTDKAHFFIHRWCHIRPRCAFGPLRVLKYVRLGATMKGQRECEDHCWRCSRRSSKSFVQSHRPQACQGTCSQSARSRSRSHCLGENLCLLSQWCVWKYKRHGGESFSIFQTTQCFGKYKLRGPPLFL